MRDMCVENCFNFHFFLSKVRVTLNGGQRLENFAQSPTRKFDAAAESRYEMLSRGLSEKERA